VRRELQVSERRACAALGQHRSTQRKLPRGRADEARLTADVIGLARAYGRYGYRRITALLQEAGWDVSVSRVARIWRREGLKVPGRQPKRRRLWLTDGSCIRLRPERPNHVWAYDFVADRTSDGKGYRMLNIVDEYTRECLAIKVARKLNSMDVIETLADLFVLRGVPAHIRSDQGPEFIAEAVKSWIGAVGASTAYIERGSPWENGYVLAEPSFAWTRASMGGCATNCSGIMEQEHPDGVMLLIRRGSLTAASILAMPATSRRCPISDSPATRFRAILFAIGEDDGATLPVVGTGSDPIAQGDLPSR
jgi:putative transposase